MVNDIIFEQDKPLKPPCQMKLLGNVVVGLRFLTSGGGLMFSALGILLGCFCYIPLSGKHFSSLVFLVMELAWIALFFIGLFQSFKDPIEVPDVSQYVSPPPQGGDATIPVIRIDREMITERTDEHYVEPVAIYPDIECGLSCIPGFEIGYIDGMDIRAVVRRMVENGQEYSEWFARPVGEMANELGIALEERI